MNNQRGGRNFRRAPMGRGAPRNTPSNPQNKRYFNQRIPNTDRNGNHSGRDRFSHRDSGRNMNRASSMPRQNHMGNDNDDSRNNMNKPFEISGNGRSQMFFDNKNDNFSLENMRRSSSNNRFGSKDNSGTQDVNSDKIFDRNRRNTNDDRESSRMSLDDLFGGSRGNNSGNRDPINSNRDFDNSRGFNRNDNFENSSDNLNRPNIPSLMKSRNYFTDNFNERNVNDNSNFNNDNANNSNQNFNRNRGNSNSGGMGRGRNDMGRYFGPRISDNFIRPPAFFNQPVLGLNMGPPAPMKATDSRPKVFIPYNPVLRFARPPDQQEKNKLDMNMGDSYDRSAEENIQNLSKFMGNVMQNGPVMLNTKLRPDKRTRLARGRGDTFRRGDRGRMKGSRGNNTRKAGKFRGQNTNDNTKYSRNANKKNSSIVIDTTSDEDEDAVVVIPVSPPPLVLIVDDEEDGGVEYENVVKNSVEKKRAISPSLSIISDDFIVANDRQRVNSGSMSTPHDDDLQGQPTVESFVNSKSRSKSRESENDDGFVRPAIDKGVHDTNIESESSDQTESIYKRTQRRRNDLNASRSKRTAKQVTGSGISSDEGDLMIDEKSAIIDSSSDDDSIAICPPPPPPKASTPFLKRGMALENNSNDDFAAILSNIIEGKGNESDESDVIQLSDDDNGNMSEDIEDTDVNKKLNEIDSNLNEEMNNCDDNLDKTQDEMPLVDGESSIGWNVSWGDDALSTTTNDQGTNKGKF